MGGRTNKFTNHTSKGLLKSMDRRTGGGIGAAKDKEEFHTKRKKYSGGRVAVGHLSDA